MSAAATEWMDCVTNEVSPQLSGTLAPEKIADAAYSACAPLEAGIKAAAGSNGVDFAITMRSLKDSTLTMIRGWAEQARKEAIVGHTSTKT